MIQDLVDMDTHEKIRYISESSNTSTSGYSTMSQNSVIQRMSPDSSVLSSPAHSPATMLQTEFCNLNLPNASATSPQLQQFPQTTMQSNFYAGNFINYNNNNFQQLSSQQQQQMPTSTVMQQHQQSQFGLGGMPSVAMPSNNAAKLNIIEQPVEKFRFRYKSEMHGTHGSLNGANSKRTPKTYPEVELLNFNEPAIVRCSLFQTNLDSPHSHQLVVRRDETDICDPHELKVSPDNGFVAQFQNMGIIHTAKKYIFDELLKKKMNRLKFELGRDDLSTKQTQELRKETEKEAKDMNLNQVRLCFEAFKFEHNKWIRIAAPVFTNPINNRKSAQTGELRIVRLSVATGSVKGGDDLILLVEKVSKKNIKVRFYEQDDDDETVWEAFGRFRESDVHHQYAIVCQTPSYKNKDIDKPVEVFIELVRPSDDERSYPVTFRYKPLDSNVSRKRRRTCSSVTTSSSGSGSSVNSFEVPKTIQDQQKQQPQHQQMSFLTEPSNNPIENITKHKQSISEEFFTNDIQKFLVANSAELIDFCYGEYDILSKEGGFLENDGVAKMATAKGTPNTAGQKDISKLTIFNNIIETTQLDRATSKTQYDLKLLFKLFDEARSVKDLSPERFEILSKQIADIYTNHAESNENAGGDSLIHEIITNDNPKFGIKLCHILSYFKLNDHLNRVLNANNESGLHYACIYDRALYIRPLLGLGCDPNIQDRHGNTALHIAVRENNLNCIETFLKMQNLRHRLDLTLRNDDGLTAVHLAVLKNNKEIVKRLLEYNYEAVFIKNYKEGNNALHIAVREQRLEIVEIILNASSEVDRKALLTSLNAAGYKASDIAKGFNTKSGNEIARLVSPPPPSTTTKATPTMDNSNDLDEPGNLIIKEEEMSSSSADEDESTIDDDLAKGEYTTTEHHSHHSHHHHRLNTQTETNDNKTDDRLKIYLSNKYKFQKIAKLLNEKSDNESKWERLTKKIDMEKYLCLWLSAEDLLNYVKNNDVKYNKFMAALVEIDSDAFKVLLMRID